MANTLGHHRSRLLPGSGPFEALMRGGALDEFQVLMIQGRGQVELLREQRGHGVLWLPLMGFTQENINGREYLAEPGMALLFRPGDALHGCTSEDLLGISILIPERHLQGIGGPSPLIDHGPLQRKVINASRQLSEAAAWQPRGATHSAAVLVETLHQWCNPAQAGQRDERLSSRRRRNTVAEACHWMQAHLTERFSVVELSQAMGVSIRTLQYAFQEELGHTPMAEAKRLRLRQLRHLLQQPNLLEQSIAKLMEASGLLACGGTAAEYRRWCGESPRQTRQKGCKGQTHSQSTSNQ
ncbi:helix-turn-helix domain-containing protein [Vulcanococcus sp.]|uniref:helix-turn-helix domain-containing protein n=1 Tax=Vulcanococcus sp. TaxID=2856995 RepID=UPI0037DA11DE